MTNRFQSVFRQLGSKVLLKGMVMIVLLVLIGFAGKQIDLETFLRGFSFSNAEGVSWTRGPIGFLLLGAGLVSIGAPRQVVSFFAALFFGLSVGFLLALGATGFGCLITYIFATLFRKPVRNFIKGKVDLAIRFWTENTFLTTLIIRLLPAGSNFLTNLAAGASGIAIVPFVSGSVLGYIPQTLIFAIMGSGVDVGSSTQIAVSVVMFVMSAILGLWLYARYRKQIGARNS